MNTPKKCVALKLKGLPYWLWFKSENVTVEAGKVTALEGWGNQGAYVDVTLQSDLIVAQMDTDELMYM